MSLTYEKLKPCPFCGGRTITYGDANNQFKILCDNCGAGQTKFTSVEVARAAWNKRIEYNGGN